MFQDVPSILVCFNVFWCHFFARGLQLFGSKQFWFSFASAKILGVFWTGWMLSWPQALLEVSHIRSQQSLQLAPWPCNLLLFKKNFINEKTTVASCKLHGAWWLALHLLGYQVDIVSFNATAAISTWYGALSLLSSSRLRSLESSIITFSACSNVAVQQAQWTCSLSLFSSMLGQKIRSNAVTYGAACQAVSYQSWRAANEFLAAASCQCNAIHFSHTVAASGNRWQNAGRLLQEMQDQHLASQITRNNALSILTSSSSWLRVVQHMFEAKPNIVACGTGLVACTGNWPLALWLCHALGPNAMEVNEVIVGALCSALDRWHVALDVLDHAQGRRLSNAVVKSNVLSSLVKSRRWEMTLNLASSVQDVVIGSACISACEKGKEWSRALHILQQLRGNLIASSVSYGAAISACEACEEWQQALLLLTDMFADQLRADVVTFNGVVQACQKCRRWKEAVQLLDEMWSRKNIAPNLITFNGVLAACGQSFAWQQVLSLFWQLDVVDAVSLDSAVTALHRGNSLEFSNYVQQLADKGMDVLQALGKGKCRLVPFGARRGNSRIQVLKEIIDRLLIYAAFIKVEKLKICIIVLRLNCAAYMTIEYLVQHTFGRSNPKGFRGPICSPSVSKTKKQSLHIYIYILLYAVLGCSGYLNPKRFAIVISDDLQCRILQNVHAWKLNI